MNSGRKIIMTDITLKLVNKISQPALNLSYTVPFTLECTVLRILEKAYVNAQKPDLHLHHPFQYMLEYFGYNQSSAFPGFLGYELDSINGVAGDKSHYWKLTVNSVAASTGVSECYPNPGATVELTYTAAPDSGHEPGTRAHAIQKIRKHRDS